MIAHVAAIFHWQLDSFDRLTLAELMDWHERAIDAAVMLGQVERI